MPSDVEFIPIGSLGETGAATTVDYARSRGRWQALPDGWLSAAAMREAIKTVCRIPDFDDAAGDAVLWAMSDFLETRGAGRAIEYRRVATAPQPLTPAEIREAEVAHRAGIEHERFEREQQARETLHADRDQVLFDNQRRLHRELADEYVLPMIEALQARVAELEAQLAQHGELEAVGAVSTPAPTQVPAESRRAKAARFLFGDMTEVETSCVCASRRSAKTTERRDGARPPRVNKGVG